MILAKSSWFACRVDRTEPGSTRQGRPDSVIYCAELPQSRATSPFDRPASFQELLESSRSPAINGVPNKPANLSEPAILSEPALLSELGRMTAGLSHELNNPLALILGSLELIEQKVTPFDEAAFAGDSENSILRAVSNAREGAERVRRIMRDLMALARPIAEPKRLVDLEAVLDSMVSLAWNEIRHRARLVKRYSRVPAVLGDESRLGQVFLNLLVNAAEALDRAPTKDAAITLCTSTDGDRVVVEVSDSRPVLAAADQPTEASSQPFAPSSGPSAPGGSLGLAICRAIVASHGGQMDVESARSRVSLPVPASARSASPSPPALSAPALGSAAGSKILIVDDEPLLGQTLSFAFAGRHEIEIAGSGREALAKLASDSSYDLILCDLMMPDVPGIRVYEEVSRLYPKLLPRFAFMTGGAFTESAQEFMDRYQGRLLEKPFSIREIEALLGQVGAAPGSGSA